MSIFLDNNASTAIDPSFLPDLCAFLSSEPMNASSVHTNGQKAKKLIQTCKLSIADYLKVSPREITFTSGGTESMNSLIFGIVKANNFDCILTTKTEHACVYESCMQLKKEGFPVEFIDLDDQNPLSVAHLEKHNFGSKTCIITTSINSETGSILPLEEIANYASKIKATFILDGVAHLGKLPLKMFPGITAMGFSAHKIHAPKGIGFFYLKESCPFNKLFYGGHQESNKRAGTENLFGILGLKLAIDDLKKHETKYFDYISNLSKSFIQELKSHGCDFEQNYKAKTVANTRNLHFPGVDGETLLILLDQNGVLTSMGSACASGALEPSRVLLALGISKTKAKQSLRISFSRLNTIDEIKIAAKKISELNSQIKSLF